MAQDRVRAHNMGRSIVGLFPDRDPLRRAIVELRRLGMRDQDIHLALPPESNTRVVSQQASADSAREPADRVAGILAGIGDVGQGLAEALEALGFAGDTARHYADQIDGGKLLLAVRCDDFCERVRSAFDKHLAFDIRSTGGVTALPAYETGPWDGDG